MTPVHEQIRDALVFAGIDPNTVVLLALDDADVIEQALNRGDDQLRAEALRRLRRARGTA